MNYTESIQKITHAIVNEFYKKDCSDKTFKAKVTEIVSPDKIRVLYSGNTYTVFTSIHCELNDMVMVCAPCNNWQELYVLQNRTKGDATTNDITTVVNRTLYEQQVAANRQKTFIVNGDANTYYPVVVTGYENGNKWPNILCLGKSLGSITANYTGNHSNGTSSINCGWMFRNGGWDGNGNFIKSLYKLQSYASLLSHVDIGTGSANCFVLWLRGGGTEYTITMSTRFNVNIYYSTTNLGSAQYPYNVEGRTDVGNAGLINTSGVDF